MAEEALVTPETETPAPPPEVEADTTTPEAYDEAGDAGDEAVTNEPETEEISAGDAGDAGGEAPGVPRQIEQNGQKYVTLEALKEERIRNRERQEASERRLKEIEDRFVRAQQEEIQEQDIYDIPDPNEDVIGATAAMREEMLRQREAQQEQQNFTAQEQEQQRLTQEIQRQTVSQVMEYKAEHPEYDDAYNHLRGNRESFYKAMGYTPADIQQVLAQEEFNVAYQLVGKGRNVAEAVVEMARSAGWKPQAAQNGAEKIQRVAEGQKQAKTLSGGGAPDGELNLKKLNDMSDADFRKLTDDQFRKIMGG